MIIRGNIFASTTLYADSPPTFVIHNTFDCGSMRAPASSSLTIANNIFAYKTPFIMVSARERYTAARQVIDGNIFHRTIPFAQFEDKTRDETLADAIKNTGLGNANREADPLWVAGETTSEKKPAENLIPQFQAERQPGERPEYYKLRPESSCLHGGVKGLPAGEVDFFGNKRNPDDPGVGAVSTATK